MRFPILLLTTALAAGCIHETAYVRDDPAYAPAPPPPESSTDYDQSYAAETPPPPPAGTEVASEQVFESRLSPYGSWAWVAPYGRVWVPAVGYGWRPYYYGQWVLTDWGWTFVSDDPWGWAAYHYGRWNWGMGVGWYWIPGTVWAPAWVSWRYGGGYVSWCPLGPPGVVFGYRHPAWVAVGETHFTQPIARVAVPVRATQGIVTTMHPLAGSHTTIARNGSFGPPVAGVQRATGQPIHPVAATQVVGRAQPSSIGRAQPTAIAPPARIDGMRSPVQARPRAGGPVSTPPRPAGVAPRPSVAPRAGPGGGPRAASEPRVPMSSGVPRGGYAYAAPRSMGAMPAGRPAAAYAAPHVGGFGGGGHPGAAVRSGGGSPPHAGGTHAR